jgi:hypothetical protein
MHEKERYYLDDLGNLMVDCKGGPKNIKLNPSTMTKAEKELREKLLAERASKKALALAATPPPAQAAEPPAPPARPLQPKKLRSLPKKKGK